METAKYAKNRRWRIAIRPNRDSPHKQWTHAGAKIFWPLVPFPSFAHKVTAVGTNPSVRPQADEKFRS